MVTFLCVTFEEFAGEQGPRIRAALVSAYGPEAGLDGASEALAYGWEEWGRVSEMDNPSGYLFRVGQSAARRLIRVPKQLPAPAADEIRNFEPGLLPALAALSDGQRICVAMVHGYGYPIVEVARLLDVSHATVRTHLLRAMNNLRSAL